MIALKRLGLSLLLLVQGAGVYANQRPFITGHAFKALADYVIEREECSFDPATVPPRSVIFVKVDYVGFFFNTIFPRIKQPIILISHNGDYSAPGAYASYLDDPKLIMWFGQNKDIDYHPKFRGIPIGIANAEWPHGNKAIFNAVIDGLEQMPPLKRDCAYINFALTTNPSRRLVFELFKNAPYVYIAQPKPIGDYLREMAQCSFVISPFGNGLDCHRTWEALLMGSIPVVKTSTLDSLYDELPVIIVHDWKDVSLEYLIKKREELKNTKLSLERMHFDYWAKIIYELKQLDLK